MLVFGVVVVKLAVGGRIPKYLKEIIKLPGVLQGKRKEREKTDSRWKCVT